MAKRKRPARGWVQRDGRLFTLEGRIISGPMSKEFMKKNKVICRTIQIRGDQTLEDLHHAVFGAFDREEEHMFEFQVGGKGPMDPKARGVRVPQGVGRSFRRQETARQRECGHRFARAEEGRRSWLLVRFRRRLVAPDQRHGRQGKGGSSVTRTSRRTSWWKCWRPIRNGST